MNYSQQNNNNILQPDKADSGQNDNYKSPHRAKVFKAAVACFLTAAVAMTGFFVFRNLKGNISSQDEKEKNTLFMNGLIAVKDQQWGIMNANGEWVVEPTLGNIDTFFTKNGSLVFSDSENDEPKYGVIIDGNTVVYWVKENGLWGVTDAEGEYIVQPQFKRREFSFDDANRIDEYEGIGDDYVIVQNTSGKFGYADLEGNVVIEPMFDKVRPFVLEVDKAYVTVDKKKGVIDRRGNYVLEPKYSYISMCYDGTYIYKENEKYGLLDETGRVMIRARFNELGAFNSSDLAMASDQSGYIGYIDKSGEFVIEPQYIYAKPFVDDGTALDDKGVAIVYSDRKSCHLINTEGERLCTVRSIDALKDGFYKVEMDDKFGVIDYTGKIILPIEYDWLSYLEEIKMFSAVCRETEIGGYYDTNGTLIIPKEYKLLNLQNNGLIRFKAENGRYGFIDRSGKVIVEPEYINAGDFAENGLALVEYIYSEELMAVDCRMAYIDKNGNRVIDPGNIISGKSFTENGRAWVRTTDGLWGQINAKGRYVIKPCLSVLGGYIENEDKYNDIYDFKGNERSGSLVGFADQNGIMIKPKFLYPDRGLFEKMHWHIDLFVFYDDGYAIVYNGYSFGVINKTGEYVIEPKYSDFRKIVDE